MPRKTREPFPDVSLEQLQQMMAEAGVKRLLLKQLAPNDNSKNQPYVSKGELQAFNILPAGEFYIDVSEKGRSIIKAPFPFEWLQGDGRTVPAPNSKLIFYPQYPEVRMSGFLSGCSFAPNEIMNTRQDGRILLLGVTADRRVIGWASGPEAVLAKQVRALPDLETEGVFKVIPLGRAAEDDDAALFAELRRIYELDWIDSKRLSARGVIPYLARNGGGYTLEAELGILNNGSSDPDFRGWEVKSAAARNLAAIMTSHKSSIITPEPDGGLYRTLSLHAFMNRFGYPDRSGVPDRINFGGDHRIGRRQPGTGLTPQLTGFNAATGLIVDTSGKYVLSSDGGEEVMSWSFPKLLTHWNKKHAKAVYVPAERHDVPRRQYRYGSTVFVGRGTSFELFLRELAAGRVFYDPSIKLLNASSARPSQQKRSQFRIVWRHMAGLYDQLSPHEL